MVKILGIVGSPRKSGNTEVLVGVVLKAAEAEGAETEIIHLSDFELKPCNGCRTCFETKECVMKDDIKKLFEEVSKADGIVIGSPVYFGGVSAQVKTFIDRVGYLNIARGREAFRDKVGGAVVVGRRSGLLNAYTQILLFLLAARMTIPGTRWVLGFGREKGEVIKDEEGVKLAKEIGSKMARLAKLTETLRQKNSP